MVATGYAKDVLVEPEWLQEHLSDPGMRVVEVDVDTSAYEQGHIPGAVGWNWRTQLQDFPQRDLVNTERFERLLSESGITPDTKVVLYGDNDNWFAAWGYWQLQYHGHENAKLLNGGRKRWLEENRVVTLEVPSDAPALYRVTKEPEASIRAFRDFIMQSRGRGDFGLVDVRSPREFNGELLAPENLPQEGAQRGGHIPDAKNIPWSMAVNENGSFKSPEELRRIYQEADITPDKEVVAYCRIGERSSHTWFVLHELLGYPRVRNYDGSWTEWGSLIGAPIELEREQPIAA